jgi:hypothetical protein
VFEILVSAADAAKVIRPDMGVNATGVGGREHAERDARLAADGPTGEIPIHRVGGGRPANRVTPMRCPVRITAIKSIAR